MRKIIIFAFIFLPLGSFAQKSRYNAELTSVETPDDAKERYGITKIDSTTIEGVHKYSYEDNLIKIFWVLGSTEFNFELLNKSTQTIKIIWDDAAYIDASGQMNKVFHNGVKYIDRTNPQVPTSIIKGAKVTDIVAPTDNVYFSSGRYGSGWQQRLLFTFNKKLAPLNNGKTVKVLLPLNIEGVVNEYIFNFKINWIENRK